MSKINQDTLTQYANQYKPGRATSPVIGANPITYFLQQGKSITQKVISAEVFPGEPILLPPNAGTSRLFQIHRRLPISLSSLNDEDDEATEVPVTVTVPKASKRKALNSVGAPVVKSVTPIPEMILMDVAYTLNSRVVDSPRQGIVGLLQMVAYQADILLKNNGDSLQVGDYLTYFPTPMQPKSFITCELFGIFPEHEPWNTHELAYVMAVIKESGTQIQSLEKHLEPFKALSFEEVGEITPNIFG